MSKELIKRRKVAVFFGGVSPEHEVSIITGLQVLSNADKDDNEVIPVYIAKNGLWYTGNKLFLAESYKQMDRIPQISKEVYLEANPKNKQLKFKKTGFLEKKPVPIDVAFLAFHGGIGESGGFQGLLEICEIPYVGSNILGSVTGMDKVAMKQILQNTEVKIADYLWFLKTEWEKDKNQLIKKIENGLKLPVFVKPANAGSSIGVSKARNKLELINAIDLALSFDNKIIVEKSLDGFIEINISVIGDYKNGMETSVCEQVFSSSDFLNFEDKYIGSNKKSEGMASAKRELPAKIKPEIQKIVEKYAIETFRTLNCSGLARVDFMVNEERSDVYLIEINTIPGSMSFYLWEKTGLSFSAMIEKLLVIAEKRNEERGALTTNFKSNILESFGALKGLKPTKS